MPKTKAKHTPLTDALAPFDEQVKYDDSPLPLRPCNWGIYGRKGCGKTNMVLSVLTRKESPWFRHYDKIYCVSATARLDKKMADLLEDIGEEQFYDVLNNETLESIIASIDAHTEAFRSKKKNKGKDPAYLILYDDIIHDLQRKKDTRLIAMLATQNRHRHITNVYLLQKFNSNLPTVVRSNLDVISYFRTDNRAELDSFVKEMNQDEDALMALYKHATKEPFSFLHINMYCPKTRFYHRFDPIEFQRDDGKSDD